MSKEIVRKDVSRNLMAINVVEEVEETKMQKVGFLDYVMVYGAGALPVAGPVAAGIAVDPILGILSLPFAALASFGFFSVRSAKLSSLTSNEMKKAQSEWQEERRIAFMDKKGLNTRNMSSADRRILETSWKIQSNVEMLVPGKHKTASPTIRNGGFLTKLSSIFGKKTTYMDNSNMNLSTDETYEYTFDMLKLTSVRKVNRRTEEQIWEELFNKAMGNG